MPASSRCPHEGTRTASSGVESGGIGTPAEACADMLRDLAAELQAADANRPLLRVESIQKLEPQPPFFRYLLTLTERAPRFRAEQYVRLVTATGADVARAQVELARGRGVVVATTDAVPERAWNDLALVEDDRWLLERLMAEVAERGEALATGRADPGFDAALAQLAIGRGDHEVNAAEPPAVAVEVLEEILAPLNEGQRSAVERGLRSKICYLIGPPGTGKTTTVAAYVEAQVRGGRRVLVTAPSNPAADVLTMAIARRVASLPGFERGEVLLRLGPRPTAEVRHHLGDRVIPARAAARLAAETYGSRQARNEAELQHVEVRLEDATPGSPERTRLEHRRALQRRERTALEQAMGAYTAAHVNALLEDARVVVTPIHNVYLSPALWGTFDAVVIDEASMSTLPQAWLAAGRGRRSVFIAGDYMQLPAPVLHRRAGAVPMLSRDVFAAANIPEDVRRDDVPSYVAMLTEQYRMGSEICELVSQTFYGGRLRMAPGLARRRTATWPWMRSAVVVLDTGALRPRAEIPPGSHSRVNHAHAAVVRALVEQLIDLAPASGPDPLLLLSPYAAQVELIDEELEPLTARHPGIRVATVYRAQGQEAHSVVLTLDDAEGAAVSHYLMAHTLTATGARLLNVGLSRAQERLLVCADVEHLMRHGGRVVRALLHALREQGCVLDVSDVIPCGRSGHGPVAEVRVPQQRSAAARPRLETPTRRRGGSEDSDAGEAA